MPSGHQLELDFTAAPPAVPAVESGTPDHPSLPDPAVPEPVSSAVAMVPDPVPAGMPALSEVSGEPLGIRMINEYVYCPRLFYYEVVESVFVHNADTRQGTEAHRRVDTATPGRLATRRSVPDPATPPGTAAGTDADAGNGGPPAPAEAEPDTIHARSVSLFSPGLRVTAKLDLVEGAATKSDGTMVYTPVEYKKGRPREGDEGRELWDADRVQLVLQILLLRENGFPSEEGIVFYKETRQRVTFRPTEADEAWARRMVVEAHAARAGPMPAPLDHSPKCPRCSLVSLCLPDETRMLGPGDSSAAPDAHEPQLDLGLTLPPAAPEPATDFTPLLDYVMRLPTPGIRRLKADPEMRRLIAPNPDTRTLYLNTPGTWVGRRGQVISVKEKDTLIGEFHIKDLHHVALFGPVQISTAVVQTLCEEEIPLTYFSTGGWFYGLTRGHTLRNVLTRIEQFRIAAEVNASLNLARRMIHGKILNQRTLLMRNHLEPPAAVLRGLKYFAHSCLMANGLPQLLGLEGTAARLYFSSFGGMIKVKPPPETNGRTTEADHPGSAGSTSELLTEHRDSPPPSSEPKPNSLFPFYPDSRNRRPPRDPVNALLSLTYSLLAKECTLACHAVGLDPYVGFMHQPRHGRPALALDLMEEFRPLLADSTVITLLNNGMLTEKDFVRSAESAALTPAGRKTVLTAWERRLADGVTHPLFGYKVSYRRAVELQARLLAKTLTGEISEYLPFTTR